jgi:hypothetical protein
MTFDDQLRRAFETLTDRLHDEISRHVQSVVDELTASAQAERNQAVADALEQQPVAVVATVEPAPTADHATDDAARARLLDAVRAIDAAHTLSDILDALVRSAAGEADRAAILLVRDGGYTGWRSIGFDPAFDRGQSAELPPGASVMPIAIGGQAVAVLYAGTQHPELKTENADESAPNPALEILVRHAARCLESVTAFKAARAALANGGADASGGGNEETSADEAAARRYAKLLVSEIKLYHESDVMAGRRERDLASRLGGEIARARVLYEQRVPAQVRQHADYFHDELVRTLANGDPALLEVRT